MALERARSQSFASRAVVQAHGIQGAGDVQLSNSSIHVAGRDQHTHTHVHYHEIKDHLKAIFDAISNFRKIQQDTLARATPGTVLWLLECPEFKLFMDVDGTLKILWGSGMPGAGKTILASIVINRLEALARNSNGEICVAYAYIRYSDQDQVTVRGILESLVKQTLERHPDCVPLAQQTYEIHLREGTRPTEEELHQLLGQFAQRKRATFYILDALDEAPDKIRLKLIHRLSSLGVRLFITSRPLPALEVKFPCAHTFPILAQDGDLDLHIKEKISSSEHLQDLLEQGDPTFKDHLISTVKSKCGGMFLHASLQLDALQDCFTVHDAMRTLEAFPQSIENVYHRTWDRILKSDQHQASLAKAAFAWVLNAQQSMTVDQLRRALATCPESYHFQPTRLMPEAVLLAACRGLIMVDKESKQVRLVHYTAKEPLIGLLVSTIPHPHSLLAAVCTTHLADCGLQDTGTISRQELDKALDADPLLAYAYKAWVFHAQKSLGVNLTSSLVSAFIMGCRAFPVWVDPYDDSVDLLPPLHLAALFDFPLEYAGPCSSDAANALSAAEKRTPLHLACRQGNCAAAQSLLFLPDTLVNLTDGKGWTPLLLASRYGHEAVVKPLVAHPEIQVNMVVDSFESTALYFASSHDQEGIVKLLLACPGIQVNLANCNGWTALMIASRENCEGPVKLLLAHPGIQVNLASSDGWTALMIASVNGHEGIVKLLLAHPGIQVNLGNPHCSTPLLLAAEDGCTRTVKLLLAVRDIDVNLVDGDGDTAIKMAAGRGYTETVRVLLDHPGINTSVRSTKDGYTAISAAIANGHHETVRLLEQFEAKRATVELGALTTALQDTKGPGGPQKERSDPLDSTLSADLGSLDLSAGDDEEQKDESGGLVYTSDSDGSSMYEDAIEDL